MSLQSVYIERDDEDVAPPATVLKLSYFEGGNVLGTDEWMDPVVYFAIGDYDERTFDDSFTSDEKRQFSVTREDLLRALIALGVIDKFIDNA
jgi:hypothetical protein